MCQIYQCMSPDRPDSFPEDIFETPPRWNAARIARNAPNRNGKREPLVVAGAVDRVEEEVVAWNRAEGKHNAVLARRTGKDWVYLHLRAVTKVPRARAPPRPPSPRSPPRPTPRPAPPPPAPQLLGFADDVFVRVTAGHTTPQGAPGCLVEYHSQQRLGLGDGGANVSRGRRMYRTLGAGSTAA